MTIYILILLRFIHIIAGVLWVGSGIFYMFFVKPSVKAIGPAGPEFMRNLAERRRYPMFMASVSLLTVLAGGLLFYYASGSFNASWLRTGPGIGFTLGSIAGLIAFLIGNIGIGPTSSRMGELGQQFSTSEAPPTEEQIDMMNELEGKLSRLENIDLIFLTISLLTMATARYWIF